jgi:hypothetical protein
MFNDMLYILGYILAYLASVYLCRKYVMEYYNKEHRELRPEFAEVVPCLFPIVNLFLMAHLMNELGKFSHEGFGIREKISNFFWNRKEDK